MARRKKEKLSFLCSSYNSRKAIASVHLQREIKSSLQIAKSRATQSLEWSVFSSYILEHNGAGTRLKSKTAVSYDKTLKNIAG